MGIRGRGVLATLAGGAVATAACGVLLVVGAPGTAQALSTAQVAGSASLAAQTGTRLGAAPASQPLTVQVWLNSGDPAGAAAFADAVSTPGDAAFHHYLSPSAYTARFGASAANAAAVAAWLTAQGLSDVRTSSGRDYVSATGPISKVQSAFQVRIDRYRADGADGRSAVIQANSGDVSVPTALAPEVLAVTGLQSGSAAAATETAASTTPACSAYWRQHVTSFHPAYEGLTEGTLPVCGYSAAQLRAAYGATTSATGKGETVAMIEDEAPIAMFPTLTDYAKSNRLPSPAAGQFRQVNAGGSTNCGSSTDNADQPLYSDEAEMDSEAVYAMAPAADQLMVIATGCDEDQGLLDAALSVLTGDGGKPSASIESNSWQIPVGMVPPQTVHAIDMRAAAEGVGMYFAAGDAPGLTVTDSGPYATAVGGTTLGLAANDSRLFETGWSDDYAELDNGAWADLGVDTASGGGTTLVYAQPAYQKGVVPASMSNVVAGKKTLVGRTVPDLAADADTSTGMLTGYIASGTAAKPGPYQTQVNGGTSLACPLVAGLVADAQQGQASAFGFINPLIYRLAGTSAFHDILPVSKVMSQPDRDAYTPAGGSDPASVDVFDSQERAYTTQVTARGYDTMTGLGTPNGTAFIDGLRRAAG